MKKAAIRFAAARVGNTIIRTIPGTLYFLPVNNIINACNKTNVSSDECDKLEQNNTTGEDSRSDRNTCIYFILLKRDLRKWTHTQILQRHGNL